MTAGNVGTALGGLTLGGVQPGFGSGKGSTNWIDQPAGLYSTGDQNITVGGNTNLAASGIISGDGQVNLNTGTLTWSDFVGSQKYQGYQVDANIDLYGGKDANGQTTNNSSAEGKYQLDDVEQSVKATISGSGAAGNITIRNPDQQAALEQSRQTGAVDQINTDPAQQNVVTKDKHIDLEPYVSVQSLQGAITAGKTIEQAIGDALAKLAGDKKLSPEDLRSAAALSAYRNDPKVLAALASCGQHGEIKHSVFDWLITPAYADSMSCIINTASGSYVISPDAAQSCLQLFQNATKMVIGDATLGGTIVASLLTGGFLLASTTSTGGVIDETKTLSDGTIVHLTGNSDELKRAATITLPDKSTVSLLLQATDDGGFEILSGTALGGAMPASMLDALAQQISNQSGIDVVYNQKSGSGSGSGSSASGGSTAAAGSPGPDDDDDQFKSPNDTLQKGDKIDLDAFSQRVKVEGETRYVDPKSGYQIVKDRAGLNSHGGSAWKLLDRSGSRIGTLNSEGVYLRG